MGRKKEKPVIELRIESIGFKGVAIARSEGQVYFVKGAVPGDLVRARVLRKRKSYSEAITLEILEHSEKRIAPECQYFESCGGCSWQHLSYEEQLFWKARHVRDSFERLGKITDAEYIDIMPSPRQFHYRNKMEFSFASRRWLTPAEIEGGTDISDEDRNFALGLHVPGRFDSVIDINACLIQEEKADSVLQAVGKAARLYGAEAWNHRDHKGFLKNLIIRTGKAHNEMMLMLISTSPKSEEEEKFMHWYDTELLNEVNGITTLLHGINDGKSPVFSGEPRLIHGPGTITENILGIDYIVSPKSFFQTNSWQLDNFIGEILNIAAPGLDDIVWDLYCGTGSITLPASARCKHIYGIELVESAISDAKMNMKANGIENAEFYCADLHDKQAPELLSKLAEPDLVIIDPPRAGMHKNLLGHLLSVAPKRICYVSCNPTTQARDCQELSEKYKVKRVRPVDMFPHSFHIESIAELELR